MWDRLLRRFVQPKRATYVQRDAGDWTAECRLCGWTSTGFESRRAAERSWSRHVDKAHGTFAI